MSIVNGIGRIIMAIVNGIVTLFDIIIGCLTCQGMGGRRRRHRAGMGPGMGRGPAVAQTTV